MERDVLRHTEMLNAFWDDVALGRAPIGPHAIDGEAVDLVERLHALGDPPERDSARERVWRDLQQHRRWKEPDVKTHSLSLHGITGSPVTPDQFPWVPPRPSVPLARPPFHRRWAPAQFATAVLVLLVLAGSMLVFDPGRPGWQDDIPRFLPAISGTPAAETVVTETLFEATVDGLPTAWGEVLLVRWTLQPSSQALVIPPTNGAQVFLVEAGEVTATEGGVEHRLAAGEVYVVADPTQEVAFRHPEEATLLRGLVVTSLQVATADRFATSTEFLLEYSSSTLPGGSGRLVAQRLTLPPGSALLPRETSAYEWMDFGAGTLGLTLEGANVPGGWTAGQEQTVQAGSMWKVKIAPGTRMMMRNAGDEPLTLYRLMLTPHEASASAAGTPGP